MMRFDLVHSKDKGIECRIKRICQKRKNGIILLSFMIIVNSLLITARLIADQYSIQVRIYYTSSKSECEETG
jgi:capsular polysaccharide biosynthesis protein